MTASERIANENARARRKAAPPVLATENDPKPAEPPQATTPPTQEGR